MVFRSKIEKNLHIFVGTPSQLCIAFSVTLFEQMHHEVESVFDDEEDEDISVSPPIVSGSCDNSDYDLDCDDNDVVDL